MSTRIGTSEAGMEEVALESLRELGWTIKRGEEIKPGTGERESWEDLTIPSRLARALRRLNPDVPETYLQQAQADILRPASNDRVAENYRMHQFMTRGYAGLVYQDRDGLEQTPTLRLISANSAENDWLAVNQVTIRGGGPRGTTQRRFDVVLYCNGLAIAVLELKKDAARTSVAGAHAQLATYVREFPLAFRTVLLTIASDGVDAKYGSPFADLDRFVPWNVDETGAVVRPVPGGVAHETALGILLFGLGEHSRFLDMLRGFTAFAEGEGGTLIKRIAMPHQYFAVTKAVARTLEAVRSDGRIGVVWHTQGSGKSMEMELYAAAVHREAALGNPTIIVITDRNELDGQLYDTFAASTLLPEAPVQITSRAELRERLAGRRTGGIFFTTLQKFGLTARERREGLTHPLLSDRRNILVVVDEAHRSHYDDLDGYAAHLRGAVPHAAFIAFTGTPIAEGERDTRRVFGADIDVYDLTRAVEDGATVPVFFEPRLITMQRAEDIADEDIDVLADEATEGLDTVERDRIERSIATMNAVYGHPERITALARDILDHWQQRKKAMRPTIEVDGKAMIVCATREICARLYDEIVSQRREDGEEWHSDDHMAGRIKVVYSGEISDPDPVGRHVRKEREQAEVKARVKDPDDPLELVIVKDMMLTGFDAPVLHTLYMDRPMRGALLMQTLARVNRRFRGKTNGLLVGYAPLTENLEAALAEYSDTDRERKPQGRDTEAAVALAQELLAQLDGMLPFNRRERLAAGGERAFLEARRDAVEHLLSPESQRIPEGGDEDEGIGDAGGVLEVVSGRGASATRAERPLSTLQRYRLLAGRLNSAWSLAAGSQNLAQERIGFVFHEEVRTLLAKTDAERRRAEGRPVPEEVERLLGSVLVDSANAGGVIEIYSAAGIELGELSVLSEEALAKIRNANRPHLAIEALRASLLQESARVTVANESRRRQFSERIGELMKKYVNAQLSAAEIITELIAMAREIAVEARRGERFDPPLSARELATYDALALNDSAELEMGQDVLARIARELVQLVRRDANTDWTVREDVRAKLRSSINRLLDKYDYPPDQQEGAARRVIEQMELFAVERAG